jgi:nicotinamidase-related amidase
VTARLIDPARTALVLMDFQAGIVDALPDHDALLDRVAGLRAWSRAHGLATIHVRVAFSAEARARVSARNKAFAVLAATDRFDEGAPAVQIHPAVTPGAGELVMTKTRVGAFSTTDLVDQLAARGIDTLILAGVATSGVVLSTVRDAADRDYQLVVVADCCADRDPLVHQVLVERVLPRQADVIDAGVIDALLGEPADSQP